MAICCTCSAKLVLTLANNNNNSARLFLTLNNNKLFETANNVRDRIQQ